MNNFSIFAFLKVVFVRSSKIINFSNPFNSRRWLAILVPSKISGLHFIKNYVSGKKYLGFSFKSNSLGLRGGEDSNSKNVIMGTSFAMGLGVDIGCNWYDSLKESDWMNLGMPVSIFYQKKMLKTFYNGGHETLIYIYHPNIWKVSYDYYSANRMGLNIFKFKGWRTDYFSTIKYFIKWIIKETIKILQHKSIYTKWEDKYFHFNPTYNFFDIKSKSNFIDQELNNLDSIFKCFKKVYVIRVPIKEQVYQKKSCKYNRCLNKTINNYDTLWNKTKKNLSSKKNTFLELDINQFNAEDFLNFDTHWSEKGNKKFFSIIKSLNIV